MHGLINRSIQQFVLETHGEALWVDLARAIGIGAEGFEAMEHYDDTLTDRLLDLAAARLGVPREALLEDIGTDLVSNPRRGRLRRLMRFSGIGFTDFLHSLDDLQGRGHMALPDLDLPGLEVTQTGADDYLVTCRAPRAGWGHVLIGILRAMADDYGALVLLDHRGSGGGTERLSVRLLDTAHAAGRRFDLAQPEAG